MPQAPALYRVLLESARAFAGLTGTALLCAVAWTALLQRFTRGLVYAMVAFVPGSCLAVGLWAAAESARGPAAGVLARLWLGLLGLGALGAGLFAVLAILAHQKTIRQAVLVTRMAANILWANPSIYAASLLLVAGYLVYVAVWTGLFAHLLLLGRVATAPGPSLLKEWRLSSWSYALQAFFLAMLLWTTAVFANLQKATIAGVVSRWYFFHDHPDYARLRFEGLEAARTAATHLAGQVCFGALVVALVRAVRAAFWGLRKALQQLPGRCARASLGSVSAAAALLERVVEHVTEFAVYQAALTGHGLFRSGRAVTRLFRRNAALGLTVDWVAQALLHLSVLGVAALASLASYSFSAHALRSPHGWAMGALFGLLAWAVLRLFAAIYSDTMDVAFLCCVIDLDHERTPRPAVHQAFAPKQAP